MPTRQLTAEIISAAIDGFESQKRRIDDQIAELRAMLPGGSAETAAPPQAPTPKGRKFSAAARKRMREAQQLRWAKIRGESGPLAPSATTEPSKPKRKLSKAGKAAIVAALKKRWAAKKAAATKAAPAVAKKGTAKKATPKKAPVTTVKKTSGKGPKKKATPPEQTAPAA